MAFLGTTLARAVAAPLNSSYTSDEFRFFMEDASSKLLVLPTKGNKAAEEAAAGLRVPVATCKVSWDEGACDCEHMINSRKAVFVGGVRSTVFVLNAQNREWTTSNTDSCRKQD